MVALLEAGGFDRNPLFRIPGLGFMVLRNPRYNWGFITEPNPGLDNRRTAWWAGKVLGGSSSLNGMLYTRGHSQGYDAWREMGCEGWGFEDNLPFFRRTESNERGESRLHGAAGPMKINRARSRLAINDAFLAATKEAGYPVVDDLNSDVVDGFGWLDVNIERGQRVSAATAYLRSARRRNNLDILTNAHATRIVIENHRAKGVEFVRRGATRTIRARHEVIVSAGAVKSPQLLMLSGIGPARELTKFGIPVMLDRPAVGAGLQNHTAYRLQYECSAPITAYQYLRPLGALKAGIEYLLMRGGGLGESVVSVGGFIRSAPSLAVPDIQVFLTATLFAKFAPGTQGLRALLPQRDGFSVFVYQGSPFSRGEVRLASSNPLAPPRIVSNALSDPRDLDILCTGVEKLRHVMTAPAIARYINAERQPGPGITTRAALESDIRARAETAFHPSGTCAMGSGPEAVVDVRLRVKGIAGLRVVDTSIMPAPLNSGLHGPALMIGEKAAALIKEDKNTAPGTRKY